MRDGWCKAIAVVLLVAAGLWYAKDPDRANRFLSSAAIGNGSLVASTRFVRVAWLPDGNRLLTLARRAGSESSLLVQHNLTDASQEPPVDLEGATVSALSISPDGRHALVGTFIGGSNAHLWWIGLESDERTMMIDLPPRECITAAAVSSDGRWVAAADNIGRVVLCPVPSTAISSSATDRQQHRTANLQECPTASNLVLAQGLTTGSRDLRFSESGDRLLSAGCDGSLRVWDLQSGALLRTFHGEQKPMTAAVFLPGEDQIMSSSLDGTIRIWSVASDQEVWRGQFGLDGVTSLALSPDGKTAAWGGYNPTILIWNIEEGRKVVTIETPASGTCNLRFSPDGKSLAAVGLGGPIRIYDAKTGVEQQRIGAGEM
jgi:WD40 repeat protein